MVMEKRARRKKLLLVGLPAAIIVFGVVSALLFLFVFGGGLSIDEYRSQVGEKHDDVVLALKGVDQEWLWADVSEEPYSKCYPAVQSSLVEATTMLEEAQTMLTAIKPPQELNDLHDELTVYYQDLHAYLARADVVLSFLTSWYTITEEATAYSFAMDQSLDRPDADPAEFIS